MIGRRLMVKLLLILAMAGSGSVSSASLADAEEAIVKIENFTFNPAELVIKPGTTVTWQNADDIPHSVVDAAGKFKSKPLDTQDKFTMTFADAGEISYYCGFHAHMQGKIVVKP